MSDKPIGDQHIAHNQLQRDFFSYMGEQKKLVIVAITLAAICYALLKYCFPMPDFFLDSYSYIIAATEGLSVSYRPKGYSELLRTIHYITASANAVVLIQNLFFVFSSLFFFFSADYLYGGLPRKLRMPLLLILIANPILILQTNLISSDTIFCSLTVTWFTMCLWIIKRHNWLALSLQVILIYLCFHTRYTAIFYPAISVVVFLLSGGRPGYKIAGIIATTGIILFTVQQQKARIEREYGVSIFSGFSGWQIANNVLCYYKEIEVDAAELPQGEPQNIDVYVKKLIDKAYTEDYVGTKYLWDENSPLKMYLFVRLSYTKKPYFYEWMNASKEFGDYAWSIIKNEPMAYVKHFMLPNFKHYLMPNPEVLQNYNNWNSKVTPEAKEWFGFETDELSCRYPGLQSAIAAPLPYLSLLLNVGNVCVFLFIAFHYLRNRKKISRDAGRTLIMWALFYFGYVLFSLFATIVLLRYLDPLFILGVVMPFVVIGQYKKVRGKG